MSLSQLTVAVAAASVTSRSLAACQLSRAGRAARYLTQEGAAGSASVFYICSSQFVEEKETLRVIYLRTISAVRGGQPSKAS